VARSWGLYATGGDAGLFWDCTDKVEPFTVLVEDCISFGRAFGGGVVARRSAGRNIQFEFGIKPPSADFMVGAFVYEYLLFIHGDKIVAGSVKLERGHVRR